MRTDLDAGIEGGERGDDGGRGACMQPVIEIDPEGARYALASRGRVLYRGRAAASHGEDHVTDPDSTGTAACRDRRGRLAGEQDGRDEARCSTRDEIEIEAKQRIPGAHDRAVRDEQLEALSLEAHGIDADMQEQVTDDRRQRQRVATTSHQAHGAIAGRTQQVADRIDGDAIPGDPSREHGIGDVRQRNEPAIEGCGDFE